MDHHGVGSRQVLIEPDSTGSDDSDASLYTDFASIASTIPSYIYQNGRRYHCTSADKYVRILPLRLLSYSLSSLFCAVSKYNYAKRKKNALPKLDATNSAY